MSATVLAAFLCVWVDQREMEDVLANAKLIAPHMPAGCELPADWFASYEDHDEFSPASWWFIPRWKPSRALRRNRVYLLASRCQMRLQVAAVANGLHPWRFKPYYCILHPLDLDEQGRITVDTTPDLVDEPAVACAHPSNPFHWWKHLKKNCVTCWAIKPTPSWQKKLKISELKKARQNDPSWRIRAIDPKDKGWMRQFIIDHWGAEKVVVHGEIKYPEQPWICLHLEWRSGWPGYLPGPRKRMRDR
jgi:hypothetical protein